MKKKNTFDAAAMLVCVLIGVSLTEIYTNYSSSRFEMATYYDLALAVLIIALIFHLTKNRER